MRAGTHGMSEVACVGCIEAMTCSAANRGISAASRICACSLRIRRSRGAGHLALHALERVHHDAVGAIADGMNAGLESGLGGGQRLRVDLLGRRRQQSGRGRLVGVRLQQRGAARAERTVRLDLDGAHRQVMIGVVGDRALLKEGRERRQRAAQHHVESRLQPSRRRSAACRLRPSRRSCRRRARWSGPDAGISRSASRICASSCAVLTGGIFDSTSSWA